MNRSTVRGWLLTPFFVTAALAAPQGQGEAAPAPSVEATPVPFLWQIEGEGASGFLFGTIHLPDDRILELPAEVEAAFTASDSFFAEIEATAESERKVQSMVMLDDGVTLDALLGPATWAGVEARFARAGQAPQIARALAGYKPWVFGAFVATLEYLDDQIAGKAPLDKALYERAAEAGKTVGGLETVEEQVSAFEVFSLEEQVRMLRDTLRQLDEYDAKGRDAIEEMVAAWLSGDDATLMALLDDGFGNDPELRARAEDSILWDRNRRLATRISAQLQAKPAETAFFAVGALHLPNAPIPQLAKDATEEERAAHAGLVAEAKQKLGVVQLLRKKGYRVTRVGGRSAVPAGAPDKDGVR